MKKKLKIKWGNILKITVIMFLAIGFVGIVTCEPYTKENGNTCRGYEFFQLCSGNIDLE